LEKEIDLIVSEDWLAGNFKTTSHTDHSFKSVTLFLVSELSQTTLSELLITVVNLKPPSRDTLQNQQLEIPLLHAKDLSNSSLSKIPLYKTLPIHVLYSTIINSGLFI
jgi:hypothetical protein